MNKMKKTILALAAFAAVSPLFAQPKASAPRKIDRKDLDAAIYRHTGGKLAVPGAQKGRVVFANAQTVAPAAWLQSVADGFAKSEKISIEVVSTAADAFAFPSPKLIGEATLFVVESPSLPSLLHAPEAKWVLVNVAPLRAGNGAKPQFFEARVKKQLTRAFCLLCGTQTSNYPDSLLGVVTKPSDLDRFEDAGLPVDIPERFPAYLAGYGITPYRLVTYRQACQQGWAPQPTNDVQKAIWDKVHEAPTAPIVIKPEPAKKK